jgi:hypothetical protein
MHDPLFIRGEAMAERQPIHGTYLRVINDQPLISVSVSENGQDVTYYFADEAEAEAFVSRQEIIRAALDTAGAFGDLDWEETLEALHRLRHESKPTPPVDLGL